MTATQIPAEHAAGYAPTAVKKRRVGTVLTAGVAGIAGVALAATAFSVTQAGDGFFDKAAPQPPANVLEEGDIVAQKIELGGIKLAPAAPCLAAADATEPCTPPATTSTPVSFTIGNVDPEFRAEVRAVAVTPGEATDPDLYRSTWVRIERLDPTGEDEPSKLVYQGPLSTWGGGTYMGDICTGSAQTFEVVAWSTSDVEDEAKLSFSVTYGVNESTTSAASC